MRKSSKDPFSDLMTRLSVGRLRAKALCSDGALFVEKYWSHAFHLSHDGDIWHTQRVSSDSRVSVHVLQKSSKDPVSEMITRLSVGRLRAKALCSDGALFVEKYWSHAFHLQDHRQGRVGAHPAYSRHMPNGRVGVLFGFSVGRVGGRRLKTHAQWAGGRTGFWTGRPWASPGFISYYRGPNFQF